MNIARALYYNADVVLLDDPLSAVDAHVGKTLFDTILHSLHGKTRILVTHALHFLPQVDYIISIENGKIAQQGTYAELMADSKGAFARLLEEFGGGMEEEKEEEAEEKEEEAIETAGKKPEKIKAKALMQEEERATGSVGGAGESDFLDACLSVTIQCRVLTTAVPHSLHEVLPRRQGSRHRAPPRLFPRPAADGPSARVVLARVVAE